MKPRGCSVRVVGINGVCPDKLVPCRAARLACALGALLASLASLGALASLAVLLAVAWVTLWAVFTAGVVVPAAGVHRAREQPPAPAAQAARAP